ncbi:MAG: MATE family efflux transporter, partial [Acetatifactor sp.]|nr:MATE family efflux transporter [Acetatifactor sp.]
TVAGSVLVTQYIGAGKKEDALKMANQIFAAAMLFSLVCATACFLATPGIVTWLGADAETYGHSLRYLRIVIWDMPFLFIVNLFSAIHQAQGDKVRPMFLNLGGIVLNLFLDPLFIMGFEMGAGGAAAATLFAKMVPAAVALFLLTRPGQEIRIDRKHMGFEREKLALILKIGLPAAIGGSTMQLGFLLMSRNVYAYGTQAMAAYGIGNKVNSLITLPSNGIGSATSTIVGQNIGARQQDRAEQGYKISMRICVVFLFIGGMILSRKPISTAIVSIFSDDGEVIAMAADFLSIMAFWCFSNGVYNTTMGLFQGTGHTEVTMAVDASRLWVFRFLTLWVCGALLGMEVRSVWYSVVVSNGISAAILYLLYRLGIWKKVKIKLRPEGDGESETQGTEEEA